MSKHSSLAVLVAALIAAAAIPVVLCASIPLASSTTPTRSPVVQPMTTRRNSRVASTTASASAPAIASAVVPNKHEFAGTASPSSTALGHKRRRGGRHDDDDNSIYWISSLVAGICSGTVSSIVCAPLDLVRTRLQVWGGVVGKSSAASAATATAPRPAAALTIVQIFRDIIQRDGLQGCFRGLTATLFTVPAFWGVYFPLYDDLKWRWRHRFPDANAAVIHMGSAVSAGAIADILCNPMFVVRTRLQTEAVHNLARLQQANGGASTAASMPTSTIVQTIQQLYAEGGLRTFWRGMSANLLGLSHVAVQFPVYEQLKASLRQRRQRLNISGKDVHVVDDTVLDLLLASGLSKMAASLLTYPHETIRSRMMDARTAQTVSFIGTCRRMYANEGIWGFYAGLSVSLIRVIPNTMLTFLVYETTLRLMQKKLLPDELDKTVAKVESPAVE